MLRVDRRSLGHRLGNFCDDVGKQQVMQMNLSVSLFAALPAEANQYSVSFGAGVEAAVTAKFAHVQLVGKIDCNFGFVGNRMHRWLPPMWRSAVQGHCFS